MSRLNSLEPKLVWQIFEEILAVPRPSKQEGKIRKYLIDFADRSNLEYREDKIGNIVICKPATAGRERSPITILQSHMDMVCEKNGDKEFCFDTDPITPIIDNGWVRADGTTLGADCGIGMAAQLAILVDKDLEHGAIEALFTVDEETGLTGAKELSPDILKGKYLINLDSEDEGEIFIGCAGGVDTLAQFSYSSEEIPSGKFAMKLTVGGLLGGHSGDDIDKKKGNSIKILTRLLLELDSRVRIELSSIDCGNLRNAIPREGEAVIVVDNSKKESATVAINILRAKLEDEFKLTEPGLKISIGSTAMPDNLIGKKIALNLLHSLNGVTNGVIEMSSRVDGMVETSTNLASVKMGDDNTVDITTSQRSEVDDRRFYAASVVASTFKLAGAKVTHSDGYCGWMPNPDSKLLEVAVECYRELFEKEPIVRSVHAGLECGLFLEKYRDLDIVSFGPTIRRVHSPDEKIEIETVDKFWKHLVKTLEKL